MHTDLTRHIRDIPDFPKKGILFKDITPLLANGPAFKEAVVRLAEPFRGKVDAVLGIESRGFITGAPVAVELGVGLAIVRKPGKLPWQTHSASYELEYGTDSLEAHQDACPPGSRVLVLDDVLATGGAAEAAGELVRRLGGEVVGWSFLLAIGALAGERRLRGAPCHIVLPV